MSDLVREIINGIIVEEFNSDRHTKHWYFAVALEKALNFIEETDAPDKETALEEIHEVFARAEGIAN